MAVRHTAAIPATSQQAVVEAALVLLERTGLSPADLTAVSRERPAVPTFAEYVPVVSAAVTSGTRRAYGSYWNRVLEHWGGRRLDEPSPSDIRQLMTWVKAHVVVRRNARGGRSAEEHLVAALRCLYRRAVDDGLISEADNPARKVAKPRRLPSTRRAVPDARPRAVVLDPLSQPVPLHTPDCVLRIHDQPRQPLLALLIPGDLADRQPGATRRVAVPGMDRPTGARSVTCCPQPGQSQRSGRNRLRLPVSL